MRKTKYICDMCEFESYSNKGWKETGGSDFCATCGSTWRVSHGWMVMKCETCKWFATLSTLDGKAFVGCSLNPVSVEKNPNDFCSYHRAR